MNMTVTELSQMFRLILHFEGISKPNPSGYEILNEIFLKNNMTVTSVIKELSPKCMYFAVKYQQYNFFIYLIRFGYARKM